MRHRFALRALLALLALLALGGCIRNEFDLCAEDPPHPDCALDAGPDAGADAGADAGDPSADAAP